MLLSGRGEPGARRAEAALEASGIDWTVVRASWFNQNFSEGYLLGSVLAGVIALPAGPVPEPFIDVDDIADVATAALLDDRHPNRLYEVIGPRADLRGSGCRDRRRRRPADAARRDERGRLCRRHA
ncbi:hypothetical protein BN1110_02812 [bacterium YEK0313]|nr:hypothetical protein BN1110_02812 [bacterium YEK0313]